MAVKNIFKKTVGEIVSEDYRAAHIFDNHRIDFCCKGKRSLAEVCEEKNLDVSKILEEIEFVQQGKPSVTTDFKNWQLDVLADYIEKTHHSYVEEKIPILKKYLERLCQVHGAKHPELLQISQEFNHLSGELASHLKKEEFLLFPHIRKMVKAMNRNESLDSPNFGTVQNRTQMMMNEHMVEGDRLSKISKLADNYIPPADACNTYRVTYALLQEFEEDLHLHVHLENNILFPRSIEMEKDLLA